MTDVSRTLPETPQDWQEEVARRNIANQTIHSRALASASKLDYDQFLLFRVLWKIYEYPSELYSMLGLHIWMDKATRMLTNLPSWTKYCDTLQFGKSIPEGTFAIPRKYQLEVTKAKEEVDPQTFYTPIASRTRARTQLQTEMAKLSFETPTRKKPNATSNTRLTLIGSEDPFLFGAENDEDDSSDGPSPFKPITPISAELQNVLYPPTMDEQIVNTALVVFLNALTMHFPLASDWTLHRRAFSAVFENAQFEARTDGYLRNSRGKPSIIMEVKPFARFRKLEDIQMQESAQVVAWIKSDDDLAQRQHKTRVHIAQDLNFIFVTVAQYDEEYLAYLNHKEPSTSASSPSYMTMHQFGPWDTLKPSHVRLLGPLLLALSLRAEAECQA